MRTAVSLSILMCISQAMHGQKPPAPPAFEVSSIKPSPPFSPGPGRSIFVGMKRERGRVTISYVPIKFTIRTAYDVNTNDRIEGGPNWIDSDNYDIIGTFPADTPPNRVPMMLQSLLQERCKLVTHRETREQPVYALVPAKNGVRLQPHDPDKPGNGNRGGKGHLELHGVTLAQLGNSFRAELGRFVINGTDLSGTFDVVMDWTPADIPASDPKAGGPSLTTAIREQLGLTLESRKAPIEYLVIDHIERPSEN